MKATPHSYDEITRRTVPEPDSSFRPLLPVEPRAVGLRERVIDALESNGMFGIGFEVTGACVILRGEVRDSATRAWIERIVTAVDGVERVESRIRVA